MQQLAPNTILQGGKYRIERVLGQGGFGNTYEGVNTVFDERVAIKEFFMQGINTRDDNTGSVSVSLASNRQQFEDQREKFKKEALRIRKLNNPHIIKVHDLFEENGTVYYVMDFVDGESLAERLKRTGKPMSVQEVESILPQILDALKTVHNAGIWHLDMKPANILIDKSGNIQLIDFGASKQLNAQTGGATTSTAISYTNGYAPREQMEQNYEKFGPWTDFYSLGATLYTLLSNRRPPLPTDIDDDVTEDKHISLPLPYEAFNTTIHRVILWLMSTNRNLRPQCVEEIFAKLKDNVIFPHDLINEETLIATPVKEEEELLDEKEEEEHVKDLLSQSRLNEDYKSYLFVFAVFAFVIFAVICLCMFFTKWNQQVTHNTESVDSVDYVVDSLDVSEEVCINVKSPLGDYKYTGYVDENQKPNGYGEAIFSDGRKYKGWFVNGVLSGKNSYFRYPNGDVFEGTFKDNSFYVGKYTIAEDGSYFYGTFKNGQPDCGTWYDKNNNEITD